MPPPLLIDSGLGERTTLAAMPAKVTFSELEPVRLIGKLFTVACARSWPFADAPVGVASYVDKKKFVLPLGALTVTEQLRAPTI